MCEEFSWDSSAEGYIKVYEQAGARI
jgi:hypothetical protein